MRYYDGVIFEFALDLFGRNKSAKKETPKFRKRRGRKLGKSIVGNRRNSPKRSRFSNTQSKSTKRKLQRRYRYIFVVLKFLVSKIGYIIAIVILAFLGITAKLALSTDYFDVKEVRLIGVNKSDNQALNDVIQDYKGKSIYQVNLDELESRIGGISIYIKEVYAKKFLPNTIEIEIVERYPRITILNYDGIYLVDGDYVVTNIPYTDEIAFSDSEMEAYDSNKVDTYAVHDRVYAHIQSDEELFAEVFPEGEFEAFQEIYGEYREKKRSEDESVQLFAHEKYGYGKIDAKYKLEELQALKNEMDAIISQHYKTLEDVANSSEYAGLPRIYFYRNMDLGEGDRVTPSRMAIFESVVEYFEPNESLTVQKSKWMTDYSLYIEFVEGKTIIFGTNLSVEEQLNNLEIVLEELHFQGKNYRRIDLRNEVIGVR